MAENQNKARELWGRLKELRKNNKFLTGAATVFILQIMGVGAAYVVQALLANWMGNEDFGNYIYAYNWVRLLAAFGGLGLTLSVLKFVPSYIADKNWGYLRGVINAFSVVTIAGSIALAATAILVFSTFPPQDIDLATLLIGLSLTPIFALTYLYVELLRGMEHIVLAYAPLNVGQNILLMIATGVLFFTTGTITSVQAITIIGSVLVLVALFQFVAILRNLPPMARGVKAVYDLRHWLRTSLPMLFIRSFAVVMDRVDVIMVGILLGAVPTGIYAVAARTANLTSFVLTAVNAVTAPRIAPLYEQGDMQELERIAKYATRVSLGVSALMFVGLVIFSHFLLSLFGPEFITGQQTLIILGLGQLINASVGPVGFLMHLTGHQQISSRIYGVSVVINILLNFALIRFGGMGIEGAAIATAVTLVFQNIWMYISVRRHLKISTLPFL